MSILGTARTTTTHASVGLWRAITSIPTVVRERAWRLTFLSLGAALLIGIKKLYDYERRTEVIWVGSASTPTVDSFTSIPATTRPIGMEARRKKMDYRDIAERAFKTAVQTFMALITVDALMAGNVGLAKESLVAAAAAGLSVVWNALQEWASS